jgi:hypothetical protein
VRKTEIGGQKELIIKKSKVIAAQRDTSVSKMLSERLRQLVGDNEQHETAKRSALQTLEKGYHLGGKITWKREDLYDR